MTRPASSVLVRTARLAAGATAVLVAVAAAFATSGREPLELLRAGLGGERIDRIVVFAYRLTVTDTATGAVLREGRYKLEPATGRLGHENLLNSERRTWDGTGGWQITATGEKQPLPDADARALRDHAAYNFIRLFRDRRTTAAWTGENRIRIAPGDAPAFEVIVDPETGQIRENHFAGSPVSLEREFEPVSGIVWPMVFEIPARNRLGRFSEVAFEFAE